MSALDKQVCCCYNIIQSKTLFRNKIVLYSRTCPNTVVLWYGAFLIKLKWTLLYI